MFTLKDQDKIHILDVIFGLLVGIMIANHYAYIDVENRRLVTWQEVRRKDYMSGQDDLRQRAMSGPDCQTRYVQVPGTRRVEETTTCYGGVR